MKLRHEPFCNLALEINMQTFIAAIHSLKTSSTLVIYIWDMKRYMVVYGCDASKMGKLEILSIVYNKLIVLN